MAFSYFPHTDEDISLMLERIGCKSLKQLYSDVPAEVIYNEEYELPTAMSEMEVRRYFETLDAKNTRLKVFAGGGAYDHYTPAVVPYIVSRSEFLTAYTPYQAEISQGTLRYIFEFQSMISELTGMDCANASMYDGATAAAEAVMMSLSCVRKKKRVAVSAALLPNVIEVISTYAKYHGIEICTIPIENGVTSLEALRKELSASDVAGVLVPGINRYGIIEDLSGFADSVHAEGGVFMVYSDPSSLAVIKTPGEWGADIVCGDAQTLGIPLCFGGPYAGFLSCKKDYVRKLPGRIVGQTADADGKRAFVLTLQAREQHIRREKATSNICSNQSLMALYATVYMAIMGPAGLKRVNDLSYGGAHYLHDRLVATGKFSDVFDKPFLKEFVLRTTIDAEALQEKLLEKGFFAALKTEDGYVSFCMTEQRTREEADALIRVVESM